MKIQEIKPFQQPELISGIVSVYQKAFGSSPWDEGYRCPICNLVLPLSSTDRFCPRCLKSDKSVLLVEYWPANRIISDFYQEMSRPDSLCLIVGQPEEKIIGFAWGYQITIDEQTDEHLEAPGLHDLISGPFFYLDEVAMLPKEQGRGVGKNLLNEIFQRQPHPRIILRTLDNSQMSNLITKMGGRVIMPISRERVIMSLDRQ